MRALIYYIATTLDGFIADPDGGFGCFLMEGDHAADFVASLAAHGAVLMGRKTYEVGLAHGVTNPYPMLTTYVASHSLAQAPDPAVTLIRDDVQGAVAALKAQDGLPIWLCGGGELAGALLEAGLIDEVVVKVNPVVLGAGKPLFAGGAPPAQLSLLEHTVYTSGVVRLRYRVCS